MRAGTERWAARALDALPLLLAAWVVARVLDVWLARMTFPWDLEWMEGGELAHAWRLARGLPLYAPPSPDWSPYIYPPGYPALLAAIAGPDGLTYGLGRAISIVSTLAAAAAIVQLARLAVGPRGWIPGLAGAACFLGTFRASGGFFDLVRPDGLAMALWSWAIVLAADRRRGADVASGLVLCAAYMVKHSAAATGVPIVLALLLRDGWRGAARFTAASAIPAGLFTLVLQVRTDGGFLRYLIGVPRSHPMVTPRIVPGTPGELGVWLLIAILASVALLYVSFPYRAARVSPLAVLVPSVVIGLVAGWVVLQGPHTADGTPPATAAVLFVTCVSFVAAAAATVQLAVVTVFTGVRPWRWWLAAGVGATALLVGGLMRGHFGGFMNVLMPVHWCLSAGLAVSAAYVRTSWPGLPVHAASALLLAAQVGLVGRRLQTETVVPAAEGRAAIAEITEILRTCPDGPILSPHAAWAPTLVGRPPSTPLIAWWDLDHRDSPFHDAIGTMGRAAHDHYWSCVLIGARDPVKLGHGNGRIDLDADYEPVADLVFPTALRTRTGWRTNPRALLVPREEPR